MADIPISSHFFTNRDGNTLMNQFEGILTNNPQVKNLDAVVGFLRASGYFSWNQGVGECDHFLRPLDFILFPNKY